MPKGDRVNKLVVRWDEPDRIIYDTDDGIEVVVHPQSVVHSFVEFVDGSVLAQVGAPSMELPVLYALTHPERVPGEKPPR